MSENNKEKVLRVITEAFERKKQITEDDDVNSVEEWDSLGHLGMLTAIDRTFEGKAADIQDLAGATSIKKILEILEREKLI